ncbi:MAG: hypothetical protein ACREWG_12680 [Gammaproteobacteria bacterium]
MPDSNITGAFSAKPNPGELATALLQNSPAQVGGMATSIVLVGQAFAQFDSSWALYAALAFSLLVAVYQVRLVQRASLQECIIIVPIAAAILFALALGSNNSIAPSHGNRTAQQELEVVQEALKLRSRELESSRRLIETLRGNAMAEGVPIGSSDGAAPTRWYAAGLDGLVPSAQAQPPSPADDAERARQEALRAYEREQQAFREEQQRLDEERRRLEEERQSMEANTPIWRPW